MTSFPLPRARDTLTDMPSEREPLSKMLLECDGHAKYTGKKRPSCDNRKGCIACWQTHNKYIDDHRPKMSKTFKRDYVYLNELHTAVSVMQQLASWFEDYNEVHPHKGLRMQSPREYRKATANA